MKQIIILIGVSGCGKTTTGKALSQKLNIPFFDADDFHTKSNIEKMARGNPLNDTDRLPWLKTLAKEIKSWSQQNGAILACSALKESYRDILSEDLRGITWVYLSGSFETIKNRLEKRSGHFMNADLLQSQFDTLEVPKNAIDIDITNTVEENTTTIILNLKMTQVSDIGIIGLGVMGKSLSLNLAENGYSVSIYNRSNEGEEHIVSDFLNANSDFKNIFGFTNIDALISSLSKPRKILLMIKAGDAIDMVSEQLLPYLEDGDVIIDGGNSLYTDTIRRTKTLVKKGIYFVGCGISGGEGGARKGPSMMLGGSPEAYAFIGPIFEDISAKDNKGKPCCTHISTDGAGHFVKTIHNGIEYVEMQLLAEVYDLLRHTHSNEEIAMILEQWNTGTEASYLLEITLAILRKKDGNDYIIDRILDKAKSKGTGSWSVKAALDIGMPSTLISSAVFARYISSFKAQRVELSKQIKAVEPSKFEDYGTLENAYRFARIINHQQGFALINEASKTHNWSINLSELARIWTNGCIIRSKFMETSIEILKLQNNYFDDTSILETLKSSEKDIVSILQFAMSNRINLNAFSSAYNYWIGMTTKNSSANLIQAQRDYFGAHTYQRNDIDSDEYFHTNW